MVKKINCNELKKRVSADGAARTVAHLQEALEEKHVAPEDFSIRDLAEALIVDSNGNSIGAEGIKVFFDPSGATSVMEAGGAVDSTLFNNITGQIIYSAILGGYEAATLVWNRLVKVIPTKFSGEKIPGITGITDNVTEVKEGMPYPELGFGEDYIETPATTKKGFIVSVTKEAVFFDRTGLVLRNASQVGELMGVNKEKAILDMVLGITNNYTWKGTAYDTYQTATPWINVTSSNGMDVVATGWERIDASEQKFNDMLDPHTGEPINVTPNQILCMPARQTHFRRVLGASEVRSVEGAAGEVTVSANPVQNYELIVSKHAYRRMIASGESAANSADFWFHGDFQKAFAWMENWPLTVVQAPSNSEKEFEQDIVARFKASERGIPAVTEPRATGKNYKAAT